MRNERFTKLRRLAGPLALGAGALLAGTMSGCGGGGGETPTPPMAQPAANADQAALARATDMNARALKPRIQGERPFGR